MSLANRLNSVVPVRSNRGGCCTCQWLATIPESDRRAFNDWIAAGRSANQLWEICSTMPDNPLPVGESAMRLHLRTCLPKRNEP